MASPASVQVPFPRRDRTAPRDAGGRRPNVALVIPPSANFAFPPLGPPSIRAYLEDEGARVTVRDVNLEGFLDICTDESLEQLLERVRTRADELRALAAEHGDRLHFIDHVLGLSATALTDLRDLPAKLRDQDRFVDETAYATVLHHLGVFEQVVELAYYPVQFLPGSLIGGTFARVRDLGSLLQVETPYDPTVRRALTDTPWSSFDIIGLSAFSFDQLIFSLRMAGGLRAAAPDAMLVLGGNILAESVIPARLERLILDHYDVMVVGDGELPMCQLLEVSEGRRPLVEVANARWLEEGAVRRSAASYKFAFERRVWPNFTDLPLDEYPMPMRVLPFRFSNGCDWGRCTFCAESADRGANSSRLAYAEVPRPDLVEHLRVLFERWGAQVLWNCSSQITAAGCAEIGDAIAGAGLPVRWAAMVRPESGWTADRIQRAAAGGARAFNFGVESFVPRLNRLMKKGINLRATADQLREFRRNGVSVTLYTLMNYPTETRDEYLEHLGVVEAEIDAFDNLFKSIFMLVADSPAVAELTALGFDAPQETIRRQDADEFPYYMIPNDRETGHYSSGYAFRWPEDRLEEKDDAHHMMLLRLIARGAWYFDRHLEIASTRKWWQPEYVMIDDILDESRRLRGLSFPQLLEHDLVPRAGVRFERLSSSLGVLTTVDRATAFYLGDLEAAFIESVMAGVATRRAFEQTVTAHRPSAAELVHLYHIVHGRLRQLELFDFAAPGATAEGADDLVGSAR